MPRPPRAHRSTCIAAAIFTSTWAVRWGSLKTENGGKRGILALQHYNHASRGCSERAVVELVVHDVGHCTIAARRAGGATSTARRARPAPSESRTRRMREEPAPPIRRHACIIHSPREARARSRELAAASCWGPLLPSLPTGRHQRAGIAIETYTRSAVTVARHGR